MPTRELQPYVDHQPRVAARRALQAAEQVAVGTGRLKPDDHRAVVARWRREVTAGDPPRRPTRDELAAAARASGIGFRVVHVGPRE